MGLQDSEQDQALERYRSSDDEVMNMTLTMDGGLGLSRVRQTSSNWYSIPVLLNQF